MYFLFEFQVSPLESENEVKLFLSSHEELLVRPAYDKLWDGCCPKVGKTNDGGEGEPIQLSNSLLDFGMSPLPLALSPIWEREIEKGIVLVGCAWCTAQ